MTLSIHLNFTGNCDEAFTFYEKALGVPRQMSMTYAEAPAGAPVPPDWGSKIMHTSIPVGESLLMGCDAPAGRSNPMGGFQASVSLAQESKVKRVYEALSEGGTIQMPLAPTFWSPLFGMCTDKFGVAWMVGIDPTPQA
jgi:PhnB protein